MKLIIVSNRLCHDDTPQSGGLAAAVQHVFESHQGVWIGWSGSLSPVAQRKSFSVQGREFRVFSLTEEEYAGYYLEFSNEVLWPACHLRLDYLNFSARAYDIYCRVNRQFAAEVLECAQPGDVVWVHDYHLLLTAQGLRERGFAGRAGYFHHIPVPPAAVLRAIPRHAQLLGGLLDYDVVGVQTEGDLQHLLDYFQTCGDSQVQPLQIRPTGAGGFALQARGRSTLFGCYPVSIDTARMEQAAQAPSSPGPADELAPSLAGHPLVLGVDRLDYSKGLEHKLRALDAYLTGAAGSANSAATVPAELPVLLQLASPCRSALPSYQQLCSAVEAQLARINGRHGTPGYTPVRYVNRLYPQQQLAALYRLARVGLVTPLQDGMNLVAKEYVAAQNPADPGVLVLSEFAGAAQELGEALLVNPHDAQAVARALGRALRMPQFERVQRHRAMLKRLRRHDIRSWQQRFLADLFACDSALLERTGS